MSYCIIRTFELVEELNIRQLRLHLPLLIVLELTSRCNSYFAGVILNFGYTPFYLHFKFSRNIFEKLHLHLHIEKLF